MTSNAGPLICALGLLLCVIGCSDDAIDNQFVDIGPCTDDANAQAASDAAAANLESVLNRGDVDLLEADFSAAHALYEDALELCAENGDALFGAAVTGLLVLTQDPTLQAVADSIEAWTGPSDIVPPARSPRSSIGFQGKLALQGSAARRSPTGLLARIAAGATFHPHHLLFGLARSAGTDPLRVSDIQTMLEDVAIPAMDEAMERLEILLALPSEHSFVLTEAMIGEDPTEVDNGDYLILLALLKGAKAGASIITSYNLDFEGESGNYGFIFEEDDSLFGARLVELEADPDFLTIKQPDGTARMAAARLLLLDATESLDDAYNAIRAETDEQFDDLVGREDLDDLDEEIIDLRDEANISSTWSSVRDVTAEARNVLSGSVAYLEDWDGDGATDDALLSINVRRIFDDPVEDFRELLPFHKYHPRDRWRDGEIVYLTGSGDDDDSVAVDIPYFPDPSFNQILPGISSNAQLQSLFGYGPGGPAWPATVNGVLGFGPFRRPGSSG